MASTTLSDQHRAALSWFHLHRGAHVRWPEPLSDGTFLSNRAKGIHKPAGWKYALSVRQTLGGPYADHDPEIAADGSWSYHYFQEGANPTDRDQYFTNRALMANWTDGIPIGVLRQMHRKAETVYEVLGLAKVAGWEGGYFSLVSLAPEEVTSFQGLESSALPPGSPMKQRCQCRRQNVPNGQSG